MTITLRRGVMALIAAATLTTGGITATMDTPIAWAHGFGEHHGDIDPGKDDDPGVTGSRDAGGVSTTSDDVITVTQMQDTAEVAVGKWQHHTLTMTNNTDAELQHYSMIDHLNVTNITGTLVYKVSCVSGDCPSWANGELKAMHLIRDAYLIGGAEPFKKFGSAFTLPAHGSVTVELATKITPDTCLRGGEIALDNQLRWENIGPTSNGYAPPANSLESALTGAACPETTLDVTGTQSADTFGADDTQTYRLTLANTGDNPIGDDTRGLWMSWNLTSDNDDSVDVDWTIQCTEASTAPCPVEAGDHSATDKSGVALIYDTGYILPAHTTLDVIVTAKVHKARCTTTGAQDPIPMTAALELREPKGVSITNNYEVPQLHANFQPADCAGSSMAITSTRTPEDVTNGQATTYTYELRNTGGTPLDNIHLEYLLRTSKSAYGDPNSATTVAATWSCDKASTAPCPDWIAEAASSTDSDSKDGRYDLLGDEGRTITLPAGQTLLLTANVTITVADEHDVDKDTPLIDTWAKLYADPPAELSVTGDTASEAFEGHVIASAAPAPVTITTTTTETTTATTTATTTETSVTTSPTTIHEPVPTTVIKSTTITSPTTVTITAEPTTVVEKAEPTTITVTQDPVTETTTAAPVTVTDTPEPATVTETPAPEVQTVTVTTTAAPDTDDPIAEAVVPVAVGGAALALLSAPLWLAQLATVPGWAWLMPLLKGLPLLPF